MKKWNFLLLFAFALFFFTFSSTKAEASTTFDDDFAGCSQLGQALSTYDGNYQALLEGYVYSQDSTCFQNVLNTGGSGTPTNPSTTNTYRLYPGNSGSYVYANLNVGNAFAWLGMLGTLSCYPCAINGYWLTFQNDGSGHLQYDILKGNQPSSGYGTNTSILVAPIDTSFDTFQDHVVQMNVDVNNDFSVTIDGSGSGVLAQDTTYKTGLFSLGGFGASIYSWGFFANSQLATCGTFDFTCWLCQFFCFPTTFAQSQFASMQTYANGKAPFAYVNAVLSLGTVPTATSDAVMPLTIKLADIPAIPQIHMSAQSGMTYTVNDDGRIHDFLASYIRPTVTLLLYLLLIGYFWSVAHRVF